MGLTKDRFFNLKNIGVIRTDKLGDMILTLPMFKILKEINPNYRTILICSTYTAAIVQNNSYIDKIYFIEEQSIKEIQKIEKMDLLFFPRADYKEAKEAFIAGIRFRVGTAFRIYSFLYNVKVRDHRKISEYHEAEYNVRMIEHITKAKYKVELIKPQIKHNSDVFRKLINDRKLIILHPGSNGSAKDIPIETWFDIIDELLKYNYLIAITGTKSEKDICDKLASISDEILNYSGVLSLEETMSLINYCSSLFANSTGIIHIAAALGKYTVGFYPNSPHIGAPRWRPYSNNSIIISPKVGDDMGLISKDMITENISNLNILLSKD